MQKDNKILMIAATPFFSDRGCHIRIYNEIKYLSKNNIEVVLCTYHLGYNPPGINADNIKRIVNIPWYKKITPGASWHKIYLDFLLLIVSIKEFKKIRPRVIHAHLYEGLIIAWFIKLFTFSRVKIIFDCQGSLAEEMYQYTLQKNKLFKLFYYLFYCIEKICLYMPNKIICSSENSYKFLKDKYKISENKLDVLNDSVDSDLFSGIDNVDKIKLRNEYKVPVDNTVIIYTGSMARAKGVDALLEAVPEIIEKNNKLTFIFAGYGELESLYKNKYSDLVKSGNIVFIGRFSYFELPEILALADVAIDPKKDSSESSGKLFNYTSSGLPTICFKNSLSFKTIGDNGIYISSFLETVTILDRLKTRRDNNVRIIDFEIEKIIKIYQL